MNSGTVKFFNKEKGFGFICDNKTNEDVFVHVTGLSSKNIKEGDNVTFDIIDGKRGKNATEVTVVR